MPMDRSFEWKKCGKKIGLGRWRECVSHSDTMLCYGKPALKSTKIFLRKTLHKMAHSESLTNLKQIRALKHACMRVPAKVARDLAKKHNLTRRLANASRQSKLCALQARTCAFFEIFQQKKYNPATRLT